MQATHRPYNTYNSYPCYPSYNYIFVSLQRLKKKKR